MLWGELLGTLFIAGFAAYPLGPVAVLGVTIITLHLVSGYRRWQLVPLYAAAGIVAVGVLADMVGLHADNDSAHSARPGLVAPKQWGPLPISAFLAVCCTHSCSPRRPSLTVRCHRCPALVPLPPGLHLFRSGHMFPHGSHAEAFGPLSRWHAV